MLLCWIGVPFVFFELWPAKGYQYLLLVAPPVAVLAARGLGVSECGAFSWDRSASPRRQ